MCLAALFSNSAWHGDSSTHCVMSVFYYSMGGSRNKYLPTSRTTLFLTKKCYFLTSEYQLACHSQYSTYFPPVYRFFTFPTFPPCQSAPFRFKKDEKISFWGKSNYSRWVIKKAHTVYESSQRLLDEASRDVGLKSILGFSKVQRLNPTKKKSHCISLHSSSGSQYKNYWWCWNKKNRK